MGGTAAASVTSVPGIGRMVEVVRVGVLGTWGCTRDEAKPR